MTTAVRPLRALCAVVALCVLCDSVVKNWGLLLSFARQGYKYGVYLADDMRCRLVIFV
jgi:hypothetical protein